MNLLVSREYVEQFVNHVESEERLNAQPQGSGGGGGKQPLLRVKRQTEAESPSKSQLVATFSEAFLLLKEMRDDCQEMSLSVETLTENEWNSKFRRMETIRETLTSMRHELADPRKLLAIEMKRSKARRRKKWLRHQRMKRKEEEEGRRTGREEEERAVNEWMKRVAENLGEERLDQERNRETDLLVSEVKKQATEAKKILNRIISLEKSRRVLKESSARKGLFSTHQCDEVFSQNISQLKNTCIQQIYMMYKKEEEALKAMLETEPFDANLESRPANASLGLQRKQLDIVESLFGGDLYPNPRDPDSLRKWQYYEQAYHCLENMVNIRSSWDRYLDASQGSSIPISWVIPSPPSSPQWLRCLSESTAPGSTC